MDRLPLRVVQDSSYVYYPRDYREFPLPLLPLLLRLHLLLPEPELFGVLFEVLLVELLFTVPLGAKDNQLL